MIYDNNKKKKSHNNFNNINCPCSHNFRGGYALASESNASIESRGRLEVNGANGETIVLDSQDIQNNANSIKELKNNVGISTRVNPDTGKPEWKDIGADTWSPFNGLTSIELKGSYLVNEGGRPTLTITTSENINNGFLLIVLSGHSSSKTMGSGNATYNPTLEPLCDNGSFELIDEFFMYGSYQPQGYPQKDSAGARCLIYKVANLSAESTVQVHAGLTYGGFALKLYKIN